MHSKITGICMVNYVLGEKDSNNRRKPFEVEGTEFILKINTVISALGQKVIGLQDPDLSKLSLNGKFEVDPVSFETGIPDVYAIGDAALGASDIISAVASGKKAAAAVDKKILKEKAVIRQVKELNQVDTNHVLETKGGIPRSHSKRNYVVEASKRVENFELYSRPFTEEEAVEEAGRCLNCGCGEGCMLCASICNSFAITGNDNKPLIDEQECVGCGICVWRCPNDNIEMVSEIQ